MFSWPAIGSYTVTGLLSVWLSERSGFPAPWTGWVQSRRAVLLPLLGGLALGATLVALDLATGFTQEALTRRGLERQHTGFLPMLLIFSAAPVIVQLLYRLLPLSLLQWLIAERLLNGRGREPIFWALAILSALLEPLGQMVDILSGPWPLALVRFLHTFGVNLFEAAIFRRYGFLAAIALRLALYLIWHVLYIH